MPRNKLWFVALVTLFGASAYAQNTFPASGNVGIGTTAPVTQLQVIGTAAVGQNTNGTAVIDAYDGSAYYGNNSPTNGITIGSTGNVGIGTTSPGARLDVVGSDTNPQASGAQISTPTFPQLIFNATAGGSDAKLWRMIGRGTNDFE